MSRRRERLAEDDPGLLFADGFDAAIIGVLERCDEDRFVVYDARKCIRILVRREGLSRADAEEAVTSLASEWSGYRTPGFLWLGALDQDEDHEDEDEDDEG